MPKQRGSLAHKWKPRHSKKTVLVIGEGDAEVTFLRHLSKLYNNRGCGVACTIRCAHGKGPEYILALPERYSRTIQYDHSVVLLDTDLTWPEARVARAKSRGVELLPSAPCIEGLLLDVLAMPIPETCRECKRAVKQLSINLLRPASYDAHFPKPSLDKRRDHVPTLSRLIEIMSGRRLYPGPKR